MNLGDRIYALRTNLNLTQKELADAVSVSVVSVIGWEKGSRKPSASALVILAGLFNVTTDFLLGIDSSGNSQIPALSHDEKRLLSTYRTLDNYGKKAVDAVCDIEALRVKSCRSFYNTTDTISSAANTSERFIRRYLTPSAAGTSVPFDENDFEIISADNFVPPDTDFAVKIQGESMMPYINDGDTVYVKKHADLAIGDVGIFCVDGVLYCKQYYIDINGDLHLLSANPALKHTNIIIRNDSDINVICYGKVLLGHPVCLPEYLHAKKSAL